jgi:hypothetical protein
MMQIKLAFGVQKGNEDTELLSCTEAEVFVCRHWAADDWLQAQRVLLSRIYGDIVSSWAAIAQSV